MAVLYAWLFYEIQTRLGSYEKQRWMRENIRKRIHVTSLAVESIATREEQEYLANVFTFIKRRPKSNPNKQ